MKFNQVLLDEHKAERVKLVAERQTLSENLKDQYETDGWTGEAAAGKLTVYLRDQAREKQVRDEIADIDTVMEKMEDKRPEKNKGKPKNWAQDVSRRFLMGGSQMLDQDEKDLFIAQVTQEDVAAFPLVGSAGGEVLMIRDMNAVMAAGDPTRSDIDTGDSAAGLAAPEEWMTGLVERLAFFGAVARRCHNFNSDNGNDLHYNQMDTASEEGGAITDQSTTAGTGTPAATDDNLNNVTDIVFKSYIRHSNFLSARLESFQDLQFDVAGRIMREAMRRMGRGWNRWFTTGTGTSQPEGIVTAATVVNGGAASADDGSGGIDYANLLDLEYAVDLAYLMGDEGGEGGFTDENGGMIGWMMHRNVEKQLRSALDTDGRPIWSPNLQEGRAIQGAPGMIGKFPYDMNNHMQDGKAADDKPLLFGACGHYGVRNIGGAMFFRFFDRETAKNFSQSFIGFSRRDGRSLGPTVSNNNEALAVLEVKA